MGAKDNFVLFCYFYDFEFFSKRPFLKEIAQAFQDIADGKIKTLSVSLPPRAGKSYITTLFCAWSLGRFPTDSVMRNTCTYRLAEKLSYDAREVVRSEKFQAVFPAIKLATDKSAVGGWNTNFSKNIGYFGQGVGGTIIGFGASKVAITDDLFRSMEDAMSETIREKTHSWKQGTHDSRKEKGCAEIDIGTRWVRDDIIGLNSSNGYYDREIIVSALNENDESFCEEVMSTAEYHLKREKANESIWMAEYMQQPVDAKGRLFENIGYFNHEEKQRIIEQSSGALGYIDVADDGSDFLCAVIGHVVENKIYVTDCVYSQSNTDVTIPLCSAMLNKNKVKYCRVETNSMGAIFMRLLKSKIDSTTTTLLGVNSNTNKDTRIFMNSSYVINNFVFSNETKGDYFQMVTNLKNYSSNGKNKHDDAPDSITGLALFVQGMFPKLNQ
jgi:predicted phage terminase large subunit-like protein